MSNYVVQQASVPLFGENVMPEVVHVGRKESPMANPRMIHAHSDFAELIFVSQGLNSYYVEDHWYVMNRGDFILLNTGELHAENPDMAHYFRAYSCGIANLRLAGLPVNHLRDAAYLPLARCPEEYITYVEGILDFMIDLVVNDRKECARTCQNLAGALLSLLRNNVSMTKKVTRLDPDTQLGLQMKAYIDQHYLGNLSLEEIAQTHFVTACHASYAFKKTMGIPPIKYITNRRLGEAQNLLLYSKLNIAQIAEQVGYPNPNYFNVVFRKNIGMSPTKFRDMTQGR